MKELLLKRRYNYKCAFSGGSNNITNKELLWDLITNRIEHNALIMADTYDDENCVPGMYAGHTYTVLNADVIDDLR